MPQNSDPHLEPLHREPLGKRESDSSYRSLFERVSMGIYRMNSQGDLTDVNEAFAKMFGYPNRESLLRQNLFELDVDSESRREWLAKIEEDGVVSNFESVWRHCDGHDVWVQDNAVAVWDDSGEVLFYEGIVRDLTECKRLQRQLQEAQKVQAIATLTGGIAHDFNNILSAVFGYTQMALLSIPAESPLRQNLEEVLKAGNRAKDLVKQILTFSRMNEENPAPLQISLITKEVLKFLRSSFPSTIRIQQDIQTKPSGWDTVLANPSQIHQILMNLCTFALQTIREKGGTLEVELRDISCDESFSTLYPDLKPGSYLILAVSQTAPDTSTDITDGFFDPAIAGIEDSIRKGKGLAVVYEIVKALGGALRIQMEPGDRVTFHIVLPRIFPADTIRERTTGPLPAGTERILLVDDEKSLVDIGKKMLSHLGYQVEGMVSSTEALKVFKSRSDDFDLIIADVTMPEISGLDLTKECLKVRPDIPVILCTGMSDATVFEKAREVGVREFLRKPFIFRLLADTVRNALDDQPAG